jgi:hypothetical protein
MIAQNTRPIGIDMPTLLPPPAEETSLPADAAVPQPAAVEPPAVAPPPTVAASPMLCCLLRMADGYMAQGCLWQAMEIYMKCVKQYDETPEAERARACLLEIAAQHERNGKGHLARSIYEQLL